VRVAPPPLADFLFHKPDRLAFAPGHSSEGYIVLSKRSPTADTIEAALLDIEKNTLTVN
jgi:hypothetical protein